MTNKLFALLICFCLFGCMTPQKATDYLKKKDKLGAVCAAEFPVKEVYVKGKDSISFDTMFLETLSTDTVKTKDTIYITKSLPQKVVTVTKTRVDTFYKRDVAFEHELAAESKKYFDKTVLLDGKLADADIKIAELKAKARNYFWIIVVLIILLFRKPILSLIGKFSPLKYLSIAKKL